METFATDVLVVGAGPTGLTAALFLAKHGVKVLALSKYPGTAPAPRAHVTNQRTMEVFRDLGVEDKVRKLGYELSFLSHNVISTSLAGKEIARYRSYGTGPDRLSEYAFASPCPSVNCQQHVMEPVLLAEAQRLGADFRFNSELIHIEQDADGVLARVRDRTSNTEFAITAQYAIGADGGRSTTAELLEFRFVGEAGLKGMASSWIEADLAKYTAHRPAILYFTMPPAQHETSTWTTVEAFTDWLFVHPWPVGEEKPSETVVLEKARRSIGDPDIPLRIKHTSTWQVNNVVATEYQKGRVFLAGDAAHRHPPYGGLGTNTSVQDGYGLAWKLMFTLKGMAGPGLLESHTEERQPVGAHVVRRAIEGFRNMAPLEEAIGLAKARTEQEASAVLDELFGDAPSSAERRRKLAAALKLQDYRSNALGVDLGQRYNSRAIISDGTPFPEPVEGDRELHYRPTTHPGATLPHAWIERDRNRLSTLDLAGHGRFVLIVGVGGDAWRRAAGDVARELGIDLPVYSVGLRCEYDDVTNDWTNVREVGDQGAVLVRPDRFIAWRSMDLPDSPLMALRSALQQVLALPA